MCFYLAKIGIAARAAIAGPAAGGRRGGGAGTAGTRLLTLTGGGGSSTTRLALDAAGAPVRETHEGTAYSGGSWLVELDALTEGVCYESSAAASLVVAVGMRTGAPRARLDRECSLRRGTIAGEGARFAVPHDLMGRRRVQLPAAQPPVPPVMHSGCLSHRLLGLLCQPGPLERFVARLACL